MREATVPVLLSYLLPRWRAVQPQGTAASGSTPLRNGADVDCMRDCRVRTISAPGWVGRGTIEILAIEWRSFEKQDSQGGMMFLARPVEALPDSVVEAGKADGFIHVLRTGGAHVRQRPSRAEQLSAGGGRPKRWPALRRSSLYDQRQHEVCRLLLNSTTSGSCGRVRSRASHKLCVLSLRSGGWRVPQGKDRRHAASGAHSTADLAEVALLNHERNPPTGCGVA